MPYDIKTFQKRYGLSNKDVAEICGCSLPTIQKWRSGEVSVSGAAAQLMRVLDHGSEGNPRKLRDLLGQLNQQVEPFYPAQPPDLEELETSMTKVMNRLELMLESRRKDKELAESEARYRSMVESSRNPVCRWLPDSTLTYANEAYINLYRDKSGKELVGTKWLDLIPEKRRRSIEVIISDMVRRGEEETMIHESIDNDGKIHVQEWRDFPVKNDKGEVIEFHSIGQDVTEFHQVRKQAVELEKAMDILMTNFPSPVCIFNQQGLILETNARFDEQLVDGSPVKSLADLMSGTTAGKFKRLLKRLVGLDQVRYRIHLGKRNLMLKVSLLLRSNEEDRYLAIIEDLEEENPVLSVRLKHEVVLGGQTHGFLVQESAEKQMRAIMNRLAQNVQVDRVYVFTVDREEEAFDNILEWCAEGITSHIDDLKRIPTSEYPWFIGRISKGQWIQIHEVAKMPRSAAREREVLAAQGICSLLVAPLTVDGQAIGFVGFDHNRTPRVWHEQERRALEQFKQQVEEILARTLGKSDDA